MIVMLVGMVTLVKFWQASNAWSSMAVKLAGIVMLVRFVLFANASASMAVTGSPLIVPGIVTAPPLPVYPVMVMIVPLLVQLKPL